MTYYILPRSISILASLIFNDIKGFQESGIKKGDISVALSSLAPLFDERCSYHAIIEFINIRILKGRTSFQFAGSSA